MPISGTTKVAGVIGWPVRHSRSPMIHNFWLERYGIDGVYVALPVRPDTAGDVLGKIGALGLCGANVTVPHKRAAYESMTGGLSPEAEAAGAVNTIMVEDGVTIGHNTDMDGLMNNLLEAAPGFQASAAPSVVLGAGGAALAAVVALKRAGAKEVRILNRTERKAEDVAARGGAGCSALPWKQRASALEGAGLLINATSLGMEGQPALELDIEALPKTAIVYDIVYSPLETDLLAYARKRGNPAVDGLGTPAACRRGDRPCACFSTTVA
ncbi:MAG: shikimate dehydrogenase [Alphaproteobacteria bacterium]|nr:shikimate dehydrogenase [Alphaproteobacteria bacterium]